MPARAYLAVSAAICVPASATLATATSKSPVTKVVTLLKDMLKQMEKEADEDQEIFDKMGCWCQTNDKEKTLAIADAENHIADVTTKIEEYTAQSSKYTTQIKNAKRELGKNQNALSKATAMREKQLAEFNAEEKDMLESIEALKGALIVLSKQNSFLQVPRDQLASVAATLERAMEMHGSQLQGVLTPSAQTAATAFIQEPAYQPQSGAIFGILSQMKETFEANLAQSQKDDMTAQKAFEELKSAKEAEIGALQSQVDDKSQELADTSEKNANAKTDRTDTKASLAADQEFLMSLKEKCQQSNQEFAERKKTRALEMEAVAKALEVLNGDAAHDLFSRTMGPAFLQVGATASSHNRQEASKLLVALGNKYNNPRLSAIAVAVRLDAFTEVKKAIDDLVGALTKQKDDEIKKKDFCVNEFNTNEKQTTKKENEKTDTVAHIDDLTMRMDEISAALEQLAAEIQEMEKERQRAGDDRDKQNQDFQMTVADQRETQKLLQAALSVLEGFYGKKAFFVQQQASAGPPPPPGFEGGGSVAPSGASGDVMELLQGIIDDAKTMEKDAIRADKEAQEAYENLVAETSKSIESKNKEIRSYTEEKAKTEQEMGETKETREAVMLELEQLSNYKTSLHADCDFLVKNFDMRQAAMEGEIEGMRQAKAILSGSSAGR